MALCELCGKPMPEGETQLLYHGYSCPCPTDPLPVMEPPMKPFPSSCPSCNVGWSHQDTPAPKIRPSSLGCWKCFRVYKLNDDNTLTEQVVTDPQRRLCIIDAKINELKDEKKRLVSAVDAPIPTM